MKPSIVAEHLRDLSAARCFLSKFHLVAVTLIVASTLLPHLAVAQTLYIDAMKGPWTYRSSAICLRENTIAETGQSYLDWRVANASPGFEYTLDSCTAEETLARGPIYTLTQLRIWPGCWVQPYSGDGMGSGEKASCIVRRRQVSTGQLILEQPQFERHVDCPAGMSPSRHPSTGNVVCAVADDDTCPIGNPVSPTTGVKYETALDYSSGGRHPLELRRYYISSGYYTPSKAGDARAGGFTAYWGHNYGTRVYPGDGVSTSLIAVRSDGRLWLFDLTGKEVLNHSSTSAAARVDVLPSGGWKLTTANHDVEYYSDDGKLTSFATRSGFTTAVNYDGSSRISSIVDGFGRTLLFGYDASNRLTTITDPAGSVITYTYVGSGTDFRELLTSVTYPDNVTRTYHYGDTTDITRLTGITDENNQRFSTYVYNQAGRVISSEHAGQANRYEFTYLGATTASDLTDVKDPLGRVRRHRSQKLNGVWRPTSITGVRVRAAAIQRTSPMMRRATSMKRLTSTAGSHATLMISPGISRHRESRPMARLVPAL